MKDSRPRVRLGTCPHRTFPPTCLRRHSVQLADQGITDGICRSLNSLSLTLHFVEEKSQLV
jgi:hypothetical protein